MSRNDSPPREDPPTAPPTDPPPAADGAGHDQLFASAYHELRRLATQLMRRERAASTLQATALVHEAYFRLRDAKGLDGAGQTRLLQIAARAMRQVLVDSARRRRAKKRGGDQVRITLEGELIGGADRDIEMLELDEALSRLGALSERMERVVELRVFTGLGMDEIAEQLGVSRRTAYDDWNVAKRWLARELGGG
jgi:RNA polymerase sigma factor (TIGR02999 family)